MPMETRPIARWASVRRRIAAWMRSAAVGGAPRVVCSIEQQEHRVAAELQEVPTEGRGLREHGPEHGVEDRHHQLGAFRSPCGQPFVERGEARHVSEQQGALDLATWPDRRAAPHGGARRTRPGSPSVQPPTSTSTTTSIAGPVAVDGSAPFFHRRVRPWARVVVLVASPEWSAEGDEG